MLVLNAFSLNMLSQDTPMGAVRFKRMTLEEARTACFYARQDRVLKSGVGHADTAAIFSSLLECDIPANRTTVTLDDGAYALVGQYSGPRLPEGATSLPEGAKIEWVLVTCQFGPVLTPDDLSREFNRGWRQAEEEIKALREKADALERELSRRTTPVTEKPRFGGGMCNNG